MKSKFGWYLAPTDHELNMAWKNGTLTLDTNVLLNLYRLHTEARDALLDAIWKFSGKKWLAYQVATEFVSNRKKVILDTRKSFEEANKKIQSILATIDSLKGYKELDEKIGNELKAAIVPLVDRAIEALENAKETFPNYIESDPILDKVFELFDGKVGEPFDEKQTRAIEEEARKRFEEKIPPGFKDGGKFGNAKYGDFYMWRQILEHSKSEKSPIIFVTAERKEDWWEIESGKTLGPRQELLSEAWSYSKDKLLILSVDRFVELSTERDGGKVGDGVMAELRRVEEVNHLKVRKFYDIKILENSAAHNANTGAVQLNLYHRLPELVGWIHFSTYMLPGVKVDSVLVKFPAGAPPFAMNCYASSTGLIVEMKCIGADDLLPEGEYILNYFARSPAADLM